MDIQTSPDSVRHVRFALEASDGEQLACDARFPAGNDGPLPVVIFVHGFKGFKDWGPFPYACTRMADAGFYVLSFNFSHNGIDGHSEEFTRLDKFEANTFSRELRELSEVIDAVRRGDVPESDHADGSHIALVGHSRGGGTVLLAAGADRDLSAVVTWAAVSTFDRYTDRQKQAWRNDGSLDQKNMRTGQLMKLGIGLLDDLENNSQQLDITAAAGRITAPLLLIHGEQDLSVRIDNAEAILSAAGNNARLERIEKTGHTFGTAHPFDGTTEAFEMVLEETVRFLKKPTS